MTRKLLMSAKELRASPLEKPEMVRGKKRRKYSLAVPLDFVQSGDALPRDEFREGRREGRRGRAPGRSISEPDEGL